VQLRSAVSGRTDECASRAGLLFARLSFVLNHFRWLMLMMNGISHGCCMKTTSNVSGLQTRHLIGVITLPAQGFPWHVYSSAVSCVFADITKPLDGSGDTHSIRFVE
jgi:hypothetical protein